MQARRHDRRGTQKEKEEESLARVEAALIYRHGITLSRVYFTVTALFITHEYLDDGFDSSRAFCVRSIAHFLFFFSSLVKDVARIF